MNTNLMFSSESAVWATPINFFNKLNAKWNFELDVCALPDTAKCENFISPEQDCLKTPWDSKICFMNPPYGMEIGNFISRADEQARLGATVVSLLPARTDTKWFHKYIWDNCKSTWRPGVTGDFIEGRLIFGTDAYWEWVWEQEFIKGKKNNLYKKYGKKNAAPFPSMVITFDFKNL